jgi:glycine dehydrogenase
LATTSDHQRRIPGRLVGLSRDAQGAPALRLALQTREQHIRRDKATSNICTAQVLLAVMAGFYAVHHGPEGLAAIARRVLVLREVLRRGLQAAGLACAAGPGFDTLLLPSEQPDLLLERAEAAGFNLRREAAAVAISLDECSHLQELQLLLDALVPASASPDLAAIHAELINDLKAAGHAASPERFLWGDAVPRRQQPWLQQEVFHRYRSETELLRYIQRLCSRDFSLVHGMIPLGSCTMKLNAAAELQPVSWPAFAGLHPFAPPAQTAGYRRLVGDLEGWRPSPVLLVCRCSPMPVPRGNTPAFW